VSSSVWASTVPDSDQAPTTHDTSAAVTTAAKPSDTANAEIASELFMSVATVKAYVSRLFTKPGVENRVQIALLVQEAQR
jgi:hypothetical protein